MSTPANTEDESQKQANEQNNEVTTNYEQKNQNNNNNKRNYNNNRLQPTQNYEFKGEISDFGVVLALSNENIKRKASYDVFEKILMNYIRSNCKRAKLIIKAIKDLKDPR